MAKEIRLSQDKVAIVDDDDFEWLNQWKWCALKSGRTFYASRGVWDPETRKVKAISMHRLVMGNPRYSRTGPTISVDHINGNGLDNRKENLRLVDRIQQAINRPTRVDNKTGQKGVYRLKLRNKDGKVFYEKWRAQIKWDGRRISLGVYDRIEDAIMAYKKAEKEYYGKYSRQE